MKVTDIGIADLRYDATAARFEGEVSLRIANLRDGHEVDVRFFCHARQARRCPAPIVTYSLISDALRQARLMPGFRRGEDRIEVVAPAPAVVTLDAAA